MLRVVWRESALDDLDQIVVYIAQRDFDAAVRLQNLIESSAERLAEHPYMYRPVREIGTREAVVHPNYILVYRVDADTVEVVNVLHTRREYPPG